MLAENLIPKVPKPTVLIVIVKYKRSPASELTELKSRSWALNGKVVASKNLNTSFTAAAEKTKSCLLLDRTATKTSYRIRFASVSDKYTYNKSIPFRDMYKLEYSGELVGIIASKIYEKDRGA